MNTRIKKVLLGIAAISVLSCVAWWWRGLDYEKTDNAYIQGDITAIAPKVSGHVVSVNVEDNTPVKAGDILFVIDQTDFKMELAQAEAVVLNSRATVERIRASIQLQNSQIAQVDAQNRSALAAQSRAAKEYDRQATLLKISATTTQRHDEALMTREQTDAQILATQASMNVERHRLNVMEAEKKGAEAAQAQAEARLTLAQSNLDHTSVRAPVDGIAGNRRARVGRYVTTGTPLVDVVPVGDIWIVANLKETQLENIKAGQSVDITVDAFPGAKINGTVDSIAPGSGAAFSLLPPDNASGNFIRIAQRVPVKIKLTNNELNGRLVPGLSARVSIVTRPE